MSSSKDNERRNSSAEDGTTQPSPKQVSYLEKVVKYVPAPIIAGYVAAAGIIQEDVNNPAWLIWALFIVLQVLTPLYIYFMPGEHSDPEHSVRYHVLAGSISFFVWVFALGDPWMASFDWYRPVLGSLVLIVTTLILPILEKILARTTFFKPDSL